MSKVKYIISEAGCFPGKMGKIASVVRMSGYIIAGRYNTNKTTLKKILKQYLKRMEVM